MNDRIVSLTCPSCGDGRNEVLRERGFGAEFTCKSCGVTSALVINHQLHMKRTGEHVCRLCGRVASLGARFCQCTSSLVRQCTNCQHEFFVDNAICPRCGLSTAYAADSAEGTRSMMERIKAKLGDPDKNVRQNALKAINWHVEQHTRNASDSTVQPVIDTLQFILNCILIKKDPGDTFRQDFCMNINYNAKALNDCDQFPEAGDIARSIIGLGTKAASLVSTLKELAIKIEKDVGPWYNAINLLGIIGVPAIQALKYVLVYYHNTEKFEESILLRSTLERAFREIGRPACDALAEYRGFFAPSRLKAFAKALNDDN